MRFKSYVMIGLTISGLIAGSQVLAADDVGAPFFSNHCGNVSLAGSFGFYRSGSTPAGTLASIGLLRFDGHGNFSVSQQISKNGAFQYDVTFDGTYQINADCTGAAFLDGAEFARLVVTDRGHGFYLFSESTGNAVYGVGRRLD